MMNPKVTGIEMSNNLPTYESGHQNLSWYTGQYRSKQFMTPDGGISIQFTSGDFDNDIIGGYIYCFNSGFSKLEALRQSGYYATGMLVSRFDFNPQIQSVFHPTAALIFRGAPFVYTSISFFDSMDLQLLNNGIDISTGLYLSNNTICYNDSAHGSITLGGYQSIYSVQYTGSTSATGIIGNSNYGLILGSGRFGNVTSIVYMGNPITGIFTSNYNQGYSGVSLGAVATYSGAGGAGQGGSAIGGGGCLSSGTYILNEYRISVPIYSLNINDKILTFDLDKNCISTGQIKEVIKDLYSYYYRINDKLEITYEHPIFVERNNEWLFIQTRDIKIGDKMLKSDGNIEMIIKKERINESLKTWNLRIEPEHNFFAQDILVHNPVQKN